MGSHSRIRGIEILKFMGQQGIRYPRYSLDTVISYVSKMTDSGRVLTITDDDSLHSVIFFSVCTDYKPFYLKDTWDYLDHDPFGNIVYFEKMVSVGWTLDLRKKVESYLIMKYPSIEFGFLHRYGKVGDRPVKIRRRISYV